MKTQKIVDLLYEESELGRDVLVGTLKECHAFISSQSDPHGHYKCIPMTTEEIKSYPDNQDFKKEAFCLSCFTHHFILTVQNIGEILECPECNTKWRVELYRETLTLNKVKYVTTN